MGRKLKRSAEWKEKVQKRLKIYNKENNKNKPQNKKGKKHTEEYKKRHKIAMQNAKYSPELTRRRSEWMTKYNIENNPKRKRK